MKKTDDMPIWVFLAFSSIETRHAAVGLIGACVAFTLYCIPWSLYYDGHGWVAKLFLLTDWEWFAWMIPLTLWYWLSLKWLDKHQRWPLADD